MGFYVNAYAKKNCAGQINKLWKAEFGGFLIYTPYRIKKEIEVHNSHNQGVFIDSVKDWNNLFPILASGRGQIFIRAMGYDEEESINFMKSNEHLKNQIKFLLDNRFLFEKITNLQNAVDTLDMIIDADYIENGRNKKNIVISFDQLEQHDKCPLYQKCLEKDDPEMWSMFLQFKKDGMTEELWDKLKHKTVDFCGQTLFQRWIHYKNNLLSVKPELLGARYPDNFFTMHSIFCTNNEEFKTITKPR